MNEQNTMQPTSPGAGILFWTKHIVRTGIAAGGALTPVTAVAAALIDGVWTAYDERSQDIAAQEFADQLAVLGERLDAVEATPDFLELAKTCYFVVRRTHQEEKLKAAARLMANALLKQGDRDKLAFGELDYFARCLESLSIGAIRVLSKALTYAEAQDSRIQRRRPARENVRVDFRFLAKRLPDFDPHLLRGLVGELVANNLLHLHGGTIVGDEADAYGTIPLETTPLGYRFAKHLLTPRLPAVTA